MGLYSYIVFNFIYFI